MKRNRSMAGIVVILLIIGLGLGMGIRYLGGIPVGTGMQVHRKLGRSAEPVYCLIWDRAPLAAIQAELDRRSEVVNRFSDDGITLLGYAAWLGRADVVQLLLRNGAWVDGLPDRQGEGYAPTPLQLAIGGGHVNVDVARLLLQAGADPYRPNPMGFSAFDCAERANSHRAEILELLAPYRRH